MTARNYGPATRWFAWRPVRTDDRGWVWLLPVWRCRSLINLAAGPAVPQFWTYTVSDPTRSR